MRVTIRLNVREDGGGVTVHPSAALHVHMVTDARNLDGKAVHVFLVTNPVQAVAGG
jgi:hypothetical protein